MRVAWTIDFFSFRTMVFSDHFPHVGTKHVLKRCQASIVHVGKIFVDEMRDFWLVRRELLRHRLLVVRQHAYLPHGAFGTQVPLLRGVEGVRVQEIYRKAQDAENDEFDHFFFGWERKPRVPSTQKKSWV